MKKAVVLVLLVLILPSLLFAVLATDAFTRSDSTDIGTNWIPVDPSRNCQIVSNRVRPASAANQCWEAWTGNTFGANQRGTLTIKTFTAMGSIGNAGILLRSATTGSTSTFYACYAQQGSAVTSGFYKNVAGTTTGLTTESSTTWAANDILSCTVVGSTLTLYRNGTQVLQTTDASISTGSVGLFAYNDTNAAYTEVDDWYGYSYTDIFASGVIH